MIQTSVREENTIERELVCSRCGLKFVRVTNRFSAVGVCVACKANSRREYARAWIKKRRDGGDQMKDVRCRPIPRSFQEKDEMLRLYIAEKKTLEEIGSVYKLTRERVRQILSAFPEYETRTKSHNMQKHSPFYVCANCGKEFGSYQKYLKIREAGKIFCSSACGREDRNKRMEQVTEKLCMTCGIIKPIEGYYLHKGKYKFVFYTECKECFSARNCRWKKNNPERAKEIGIKATKNYYKKYRNDPVFKERLREYWRKNYLLHGDRIRAYYRERYRVKQKVAEEKYRLHRIK